MLIISKKSIDLKEQVKKMSKLKSLVLCGLLIAMYIVLYYCNIVITTTIQFRLSFLVIAAAGLYGGPLMGLTVGILGDVLSMLVTGGQGATFFFGFTLSYAILGFFFGLIFHGVKMNISRAIAGGLVEFCVSLFINTYWLSILYGLPYQTMFFTRIPKCLLMLVISVTLLYLFLKAFSAMLIGSHFYLD